jgi:hypothetical protein
MQIQVGYEKIEICEQIHSMTGTGRFVVRVCVSLSLCHFVTQFLFQEFEWNFHSESICEICEIVILAKQKWLIRMETCGMRCQ